MGGPERCKHSRRSGLAFESEEDTMDTVGYADRYGARAGDTIRPMDETAAVAEREIGQLEVAENGLDRLASDARD